jgi:hypothetical protein
MVCDHSGRGIYGPKGLGPLEHRDREPESHLRHGLCLLSSTSVSSCVGSGLATG